MLKNLRNLLLAVDSGADCGWALFSDAGELVACGLREFPEIDPRAVSRIVVERPHTGKTRARKKDVITLAIRAGEVGGVWSYLTGVKPVYIEPTKWKGSTRKDISHSRTHKRLSEVERKVFETCPVPKGKRHNVLDAVGIGLYVCGR